MGLFWLYRGNWLMYNLTVIGFLGDRQTWQQTKKEPLATMILTDPGCNRGWLCEANYDHFLLAGQILLSSHTSYAARQTNRASWPLVALWVCWYSLLAVGRRTLIVVWLANCDRLINSKQIGWAFSQWAVQARTAYRLVAQCPRKQKNSTGMLKFLLIILYLTAYFRDSRWCKHLCLLKEAPSLGRGKLYLQLLCGLFSIKECNTARSLCQVYATCTHFSCR